MKIKHTIKRDGRKLEGRITHVELEGSRRHDAHYSKDGKFSLCSMYAPELVRDKLFVWGEDREKDNQNINKVFHSEEEAQEVLDYINEFTIPETLSDEAADRIKGIEYTPGQYIEVSNDGEKWVKRKYITRTPAKWFIVQTKKDESVHNYMSMGARCIVYILGRHIQ